MYVTSQDWSLSASIQWGEKEECHWILTGPLGASRVLSRCVQGLQQGLLVWRQEVPSEFDVAYADFLSLDISMLRLFETFLETTPQLTLVLAIILQSGSAEYYQCECQAQGQPPLPTTSRHPPAPSCLGKVAHKRQKGFLFFIKAV